MKNILIIVFTFFITNLLFSQENISFDDFTTGNYENGIMLIELKMYQNNIVLANKYKKILNKMPVINKYSNENNTIYTYTGYIVHEEDVIIMDVKLKLLNGDINIKKELISEFKIKNNEIEKLIESAEEDEAYIIEEEDSNGKFTMSRQLYVNDTSAINDNFSMFYALIILANLSEIGQEKVSRRLWNYITEFAY
jgi:hypothetical protein